ncbi:unnamed protein product [Cylicocyclus nassatus]|uniref:Uncharacterized protein n=1 Tax=Cylicocyclus nassatus TaxID=53992 RepID=A0AA36HG29_CYLNA|nr:unnamed protein product [Cylicocyclus nassatus]
MDMGDFSVVVVQNRQSLVRCSKNDVDNEMLNTPPSELNGSVLSPTPTEFMAKNPAKKCSLVDSYKALGNFSRFQSPRDLAVCQISSPNTRRPQMLDVHPTFVS